jgi:hypothetical protein
MSNVTSFDPSFMPTTSSAFAALFAQKPKMLTDEVQSVVIKAYDLYPELRPLIGADNDADALEGSIKDNIEAVVTIIREFAKKNASDFPLAAEAKRRQIRHAYGVVRRRTFAAMQAANALTDQSKVEAAE